MRYIRFTGGDRYPNPSFESYRSYDDSISDRELDNIAYDNLWFHWDEVSKEEFERSI